MCISGVRCPDVLWLFDARWRYLGYDCPVYDIYQTWPDYPRKQNLSIPVIEEYWNNLITINMNKSSTNASVLAIIDNTAKDGYMNIMHNITNINVTLLQEDIGASLFPGCDVGKIRFIIYSVVLLLLYLSKLNQLFLLLSPLDKRSTAINANSLILYNDFSRLYVLHILRASLCFSLEHCN